MFEITSNSHVSRFFVFMSVCLRVVVFNFVVYFLPSTLYRSIHLHKIAVALTTHPLDTLWSASPLTRGSRDTSCGLHSKLSWGRRDDDDSVGVIGAGVIGADQVDALPLFFFFTYLEKSLPEEH